MQRLDWTELSKEDRSRRATPCESWCSVLILLCPLRPYAWFCPRRLVCESRRDGFRVRSPNTHIRFWCHHRKIYSMKNLATKRFIKRFSKDKLQVMRIWCLHQWQLWQQMHARLVHISLCRSHTQAFQGLIGGSQRGCCYKLLVWYSAHISEN